MFWFLKFKKIKNVLKLSLKEQKKIKNILRTFEAENRQNFKNIQPEPKKPGSCKKQVYTHYFY